MADRFEDMRVYIQVVESGGIALAAERLSLATSAVSRRIKELEERLGVQLIQRTTRKMSITEQGKQFYENAIRIMADLNEAEQVMKSDRCKISGTLRIAVPLSFGNIVLMPAITDFMKDNPDIVLDIDMSDRRVDLVDEGFDAAIRIGDLADSSLIARKLCHIKLLACAAPSYIENHNGLGSLDDFINIIGLIYANARRAGGAWQVTTPDNQTKTIKPIMRMRCTDGSGLMQAAKAGLGVVCEPDFIVKEALDTGDLQLILPDHDWGAHDVNILYTQNKHMPVRLRSFIDHMVDALKAI